MSFELVYTSARRGLRTGASGFCTVAATDGIPRALQDKLESLSGYRHTEAAYGHAPPINYSHLTVRIQRKIFHVVSRIGDAGTDSTGRTNKIAHHLALNSGELSRFTDGPAPLFTDDDFWFDVWDSEPEILEDNRLPRSQCDAVHDFETWEDVFGDAGWAGVLGNAVANGMKSVSVIVPNTNYTLTLLNEALQLVPVQNRWKVCFSTYYSRHVSGMQCHWRFVLDGTAEARKLRARVQGDLVDPAGSSGTPPDDNPFVKAARKGRPELAFQSSPSRSGRRAVIPQSDNSEPEDRYAAAAARRRNRNADPDDDDEDQDRRPGFGQRRRRPVENRKAAPMPSRSPFDIPEEAFASEESEKGGASPGTNGKRPAKSSPNGALLLVAALTFALLAILVYFGIQQLS